MSLKAKIEAVLYAADDPVTHAQLAALFGEEALAAAQREESFAFEPSGDSSGDETVETDGPPSTAEVSGSGDSGDSEPSQPAIESGEEKRQMRLREREAKAAIGKIVEELIAEYTSGDRGMEIREIAGGYRIATRAEYHDAVRQFVKNLKPQMKLSLQALETLAVVAYKQPITAPEISEIRGVDTSGVLGGLMARKLITTAGRKQVIGRPILYKTTKEFLLRFGLKDVRELPSMEEFEKMAADLADEVADGPESAETENRASLTSVETTPGEGTVPEGEVPEPEEELSEDKPGEASLDPSAEAGKSTP